MHSENIPSGKVRLRRVMRGTEYFTLAFGSIVGVGWMIVLDEWFRRGGPAGAMLGFLVGGVALVPIVYAYGRLAEKIPEAATEVAYTAAVFPRSISFATGWSLTLTYVMVCPWEAVSMGRIAAYLFPGIRTMPLYEIAGKSVFLPFLVIAVLITIVVTWINYRGVHQSTAFQNITTFGLLAIFCVFAPLGLARGNVENLRPAFADHGGANGLLSTLLVLQIAPYYLLGFETIPKCAEEAAADFPPRRFLRIMLLALGVATLFYVSIPGVVALLQPWQSLVSVEFATAVAFEKAFRSPWLVRLIMLGVVLSLLKVFNGNFLAATRLLYAMGSKNLLGGRLGTVHTEFQTPAAAVLLVGLVTFCAVFLGEAILVPITEVGSFTCTLGWAATCAAFCCGATGKLSVIQRAVGIVGLLGAASLVVIVAAGFGFYEWLVSAVWAGCGAALWLTRARSPATKPNGAMRDSSAEKPGDDT
jgi:basic amino acid/polyamine antiporter, APA family